MFPILFAYIFIQGLSLSHVFLRYILKNLDYLTQNMIHQVIQTLHSMPQLIF